MGVILAVIRFFERQPKPLILAIAFVSLVLLSLADALSGYQAAIGFLYLVPVSFTTWHVGLRGGIFFSVLSGFIWASVAAFFGIAHGQLWMLFWNASTRLVVFLLVTLLLSALRTAHNRAIMLARTDALTGTANTRWFREALEQEILRCRRYRHPFTVIYGDLDNFKAVNDRMGHAVGDALLRKVAEAIQLGVRRTDVVARLGGDEFAVLLPETGETAGHLVAQQLRESVLDVMQRHAWPVGGSFGVVTCVDPPASADALLNLADELMYAAKREGKGGVRHAVFAMAPTPDHDLPPGTDTDGVASRSETPGPPPYS